MADYWRHHPRDDPHVRHDTFTSQSIPAPLVSSTVAVSFAFLCQATSVKRLGRRRISYRKAFSSDPRRRHQWSQTILQADVGQWTWLTIFQRCTAFCAKTGLCQPGQLCLHPGRRCKTEKVTHGCWYCCVLFIVDLNKFMCFMLFLFPWNQFCQLKQYSFGYFLLRGNKTKNKPFKTTHCSCTTQKSWWVGDIVDSIVKDHGFTRFVCMHLCKH